MKISVFWKTVIMILAIVIVFEIVTFCVVFNYTYDNTVEQSTDRVRECAATAEYAFEFCDPNDLESCREYNEIFDRICKDYDVTYLYAVKPDIEKKSELYLAKGSGEGASEEFVNNRYTGYYAEGYLRDEQIRAFEGDDSGVILHEINQYDDTIICYMPVKRYYSNEDNGIVERTESIVCAEISVSKVMEEFRKSFTKVILLLLFFTVLMLFAAGIIFYFTVTKPLGFISGKMKEFAANCGGKFEKLPVKGNDELSDVSDSFNVMAEKIGDYLKEVGELNKQKTELNIARTIQMGFLEPNENSLDAADIGACMLPARDVGGDLYDYAVLKDGRIFAAIADVSGKGVTAALLMSRAIALLHQYAEAGMSPGRILYLLNNKLADHNPKMMFLTTFIAIFDPASKELIYSNAGHNYPYILSDRSKILHDESCMAAGIFPDSEYDEHCVKMDHGDTLFMFTDGVTEAQNKDGELFGEERLEKALDEVCRKGGNVIDAVLGEVKKFTDGTEQADDITMLTLRIKDRIVIDLHLDAKKEELLRINEIISKMDIGEDARFALGLIAEEVFVNICEYAYPEGGGEADIRFEVNAEEVTLTFTDSGISFDTTENVIDIDDYDMDNAIGGLGRFLTFNLADSHSYERIDGKNVLTVTKKLAADSEQKNPDGIKN